MFLETNNGSVIHPCDFNRPKLHLQMKTLLRTRVLEARIYILQCGFHFDILNILTVVYLSEKISPLHK